MGMYPFREYVDRYMETVRDIYQPETWKTRYRRYKRMEQKLITLKSEGKISTLSPKSMTEEDVRTYLLFMKTKVSQNDLVHEANALDKILLFSNNHAVKICFSHNPGLKPKTKNVRKKSMPEEVYQAILKGAQEVDPTDFKMVRAYTLVLMCINLGTRNKEIRLADIDDLDTESWNFDIIHVKGEATYGQEREVPVPPEIRELLLMYVLGRKKWCMDNNCHSSAFFPSKDSDDGFCSGNTLRRWKDMVQDKVGVKFDLRLCRRTFGQRYLDRDLDIESVSVLMGHASTKTTEGFYSRKKLNRAMEKARNVWGNDVDGKKKDDEEVGGQ